MRTIVDIVGFQISWWASALGAGAGRWEPGVAAGIAVVLLQLAVSGKRRATLAAVVAAAVLGIAFESAMIASGLVHYSASWPIASLSPVWLIALWMVFGTCIEATIRLLGERPMLRSALLGAILAPPTYWAGTGFGALSLMEPLWLPLGAVAMAWAIATPLMILAYRRAGG